jgi:hypothetical protein
MVHKPSNVSSELYEKPSKISKNSKLKEKI